MGCGDSKHDQPEKQPIVQAETKPSKQELIDKYGKVVIDWIVAEQEQEIKQIIQEGFSPDLIFEINGEHQTTILLLAIIYKKTNLAKMLIEIKQDLNLQIPQSKDCPLISAIRGQNSQLVEALLKKGANKNIKTIKNESLYDIANKLLSQNQIKVNNQGVQNMENIIKLLDKDY